jgi:hypothetical protein
MYADYQIMQTCWCDYSKLPLVHQTEMTACEILILYNPYYTVSTYTSISKTRTKLSINYTHTHKVKY